MFPDFGVFRSFNGGWDEEAFFADELGCGIEFQGDLHFTCVGRGVMQHGFQQGLVSQSGKARDDGLDHEGLIDGEGGLATAKEVGTTDGDGHEAIAGEIVWSGNVGGDLTFSVGHGGG